MWCPRVRLGLASCIVLFPLFLHCPTLRCVCVRYHSIVGLASCVCDRVVLFGVACGDYCLLSVVDSFVLWCVVVVVVRVMPHCVVGCGMAGRGEGVCGLVACLLFLFFLFFLFVLVFGVVRAQLCEHARYPRTPLCSLVLSCCCSLLLFLSAPRFSSVVGIAAGVYHVSVCCVGMTAIGSLSLSFSFFW